VEILVAVADVDALVSQGSARDRLKVAKQGLVGIRGRKRGRRSRWCGLWLRQHL